MQIFTKMANRWAERECETPERESFRAALADTELEALNAHDSYLINLASPDTALRARSLESFVCELRRCEALGLGALVSHPGNFMDDRASGLARNADAIAEALSRVPGRRARAARDDRRQRHRARRDVRGAGGDHRARARPASSARRRVHRHRAHLRRGLRHLATHYDDVMARFDVDTRPRAPGRDASQRLEGAVRFATRPARADRRGRHRRASVPADHDRRATCRGAEGHRDAEARRPSGRPIVGCSSGCAGTREADIGASRCGSLRIPSADG